MAKKNTNQPTFDYTNEENHPLLKNIFRKIKSDITLEEAIKAHKTLFKDISKPVTEEDVLNYFNKL